MTIKSQIARFCISVVVFSVYGIQLNAQAGIYSEDEVVNMQVWLDYNPSYLINNKTSIYGDVGARTIFPQVWHRAILRPSIRYDLTTFNEKTDRYRTW